MSELDICCFDEDYEELLKTEVGRRWGLKKTGDLEVTATIPAKDEQFFVARLRWRAYPSGVPSLKFLDDAGNDTNPMAWPTGQGFRPGSLDTCMHWTQEGHVLHPAWAGVAAYRLDPAGNPLAQAIDFLQHWFIHEYQGRHK